MRQLIFLFLLFLPVFSFGQKKINSIPAGVWIVDGTVKDAVTKKGVSASLKISWGDSSRIISSNARGVLSKGDFFHQAIVDSLIISSASPFYHVTNYKVKKYEWGKVTDANGKETSEMWYSIELFVFVAKNKE